MDLATHSDSDSDSDSDSSRWEPVYRYYRFFCLAAAAAATAAAAAAGDGRISSTFVGDLVPVAYVVCCLPPYFLLPIEDLS